MLLQLALVVEENNLILLQRLCEILADGLTLYSTQLAASFDMAPVNRLQAGLHR